MQPRRFALRSLGLPLAIAVLALVAFAACSSEEEAPPLGPGEVEFTSTDGVTLRGRHYGDGALTVVLAHMRPSDQESWTPFAESAGGRGVRGLHL